MYHNFHTGSLQLSCSFPKEKTSFLFSMFKDAGCIQKLNGIHIKILGLRLSKNGIHIKILGSRLSKNQEIVGHGWTLRYYAEKNKSDRGRQIQYDFTHIQIYNTSKIKHKINERTTQKHT